MKTKEYTQVRILDKRCNETRNIIFYERRDALEYIRKYANRSTDVITLIKTYDETLRRLR